MQGDWRLYFLFRDRVEEVTPNQCTEMAKSFLTRNNRTLGLFLPTAESDRVQMPDKPDLQEILSGYEGRDELEAGEQFDSSPLAIESRTTRSQLPNGIKTAWLTKKTRGSAIHIEINLRYGNEDSLGPYTNVLPFIPQMLLRGTRRLDHGQLQDRLDELRADIHASGTTGLVNMCVETKRQALPDLMPLIGEMLREPRFDADELEILRRQAITSAEAHMTEPSSRASLALQRALAPYSSDNLRYVPALEERIARYKTVTAEQLMDLHATQMSGTRGEIAAVGDFDPIELANMFQAALGEWSTNVNQMRLNTPAQTQIAGTTSFIETPDKENAVYYAGMHLAMRDDHVDFPGLLVGNYIFVRGTSSRLGDRVRQQEGLSYGVGSSLDAHPIDERTSFTLYAITNPQNKDLLLSVIGEELQKLIGDGVTEEELASAKQGILQSCHLDRTQDANLTGILASTMFANRDMSYYANFEERIAELTVADVNKALQKHLDPRRLVIFFAGDFQGRS